MCIQVGYRAKDVSRSPGQMPISGIKNRHKWQIVTLYKWEILNTF